MSSKNFGREQTGHRGDFTAGGVVHPAHSAPCPATGSRWLTGSPANRTVTAAAENAVGPGFRVDELERERVGSVEWSASVIDSDGREHLVLLDRTGQVLLVREDR